MKKWSCKAISLLLIATLVAPMFSTYTYAEEIPILEEDDIEDIAEEKTLEMEEDQEQELEAPSPEVLDNDDENPSEEETLVELEDAQNPENITVNPEFEANDEFVVEYTDDTGESTAENDNVNEAGYDEDEEVVEFEDDEEIVSDDAKGANPSYSISGTSTNGQGRYKVSDTSYDFIDYDKITVTMTYDAGGAGPEVSGQAAVVKTSTASGTKDGSIPSANIIKTTNLKTFKTGSATKTYTIDLTDKTSGSFKIAVHGYTKKDSSGNVKSITVKAEAIPHSHSYGSWTTSKAATCTAAGSKYRTCSGCGNKETASIAATGHSNTATGALRSAATCTAKATYWYKCSKCGTQASTYFESGNALGHDYSTDSGVQYSAATCTAPRYNYKKCSRCGSNPKSASYIVATGSALGHSNTAQGALRSSATCTAPATYYYKCSRCGTQASTYFNSGNALGHNYATDSGIQYSAATCTAPRYNYKKCSRCGYNPQSSSYIVATGSALGHSKASSPYSTTAATCIDASTELYKCVRYGTGGCTQTYTEHKTAALGHNYQTATASSNNGLKSAATCTAPAVYYQKCSRCSAKDTSKYNNVGNALGHDFSNTSDNGSKRSDATYEEAATYWNKCSRCNTYATAATAPNSYHSVGSTLVAVTDVTLDETSVDMFTGATKQLTATVTPSNATNKNLMWSSDDTEVATIDNNGNITAVGNGSANITAAATDGSEAMASCTVFVTTPVSGVSVSLDTLTLNPGQTDEIVATILPETASNKNVIWSSSNEDCARVDKNGRITAIANGSANITVTTVDGNKTASCLVKVITPVTGITIAPTKFTLNPGQFVNIETNVEPATASDKSIIWTSDDEDVAEVNGGKITAIANGVTTITATAADGSGKYATCEITVYTPVQYVEINDSELSLCVDTFKTLSVTIFPATASNQNVTWTSDAEDIAIVDKNGKVTGKKAGTAKITAKVEEKEAICDVTVLQPVTNAYFDETSIEMHPGDTKTIQLTVLPDDASDVDVVFGPMGSNALAQRPKRGYSGGNTPSDSLDFVIDDNNNTVTITAIRNGSGTVKANVFDNVLNENFNPKCDILVTTPAAGVMLYDEKIGLHPGDTFDLVYEMEPWTATNDNVTWTSDNEGVATVDENGKVTGIGNGAAIITVTTEDGGFTATCEVSVSTLVTGVNLDKTHTSFFVGESVDLVATVLPETASDKSIVWSSDDENVAKVNENGKVVGVGVGETTIKVTTVDQEKIATCFVNVKPVKVTGVALNKNEASVYIGSYETLSATISPVNATNKGLTWSSENPDIVTVVNGRIKGVGVGKANVIVKTDDGNFTDTCEITVLPVNVSSVHLNKDEATLLVGRSLTLRAVVEPENATNKKITWSSSDTDVATVTNEGYVEAKNLGETDITVTTEDQDKQAVCHITVNPVVPARVLLNKDEAYLTVGQSKSLVATVLPEDATDKSVVWTSDCESVATVSADGKITGLDVGTAIIKATTNSEQRVALCAVVVSSTEVHHTLSYGVIKHDDKDDAEKEKDYMAITGLDGEATGDLIAPSSAKGETVEAIGNEAFKDQTGFNGMLMLPDTIKIIGEGAFFGCSNLSGTLVFPESVTEILKEAFRNCSGFTGDIILPPNLTTIGDSAFAGMSGIDGKLFIPSNVTNIGEDAFKGMFNVDTIENASNIEISASQFINETDKDDVCLKDENGNRVFYDGKIVKGKYTRYYVVKSVSLNKKTATMKPNTTLKLVASVLSDKAFDKSLIWTSSDPSIATVSEDGIVTAKKNGNAVIKATSKDSGLSDECQITVSEDAKIVEEPLPINPTPSPEPSPTITPTPTPVPPVLTGIKLNKTKVTIIKGKTLKLKVTAKPNKSIKLPALKWSSSNKKIASVDKNGRIKAKKKGKVTITVKTADGRYKATCKVTVKNPVKVKSVKLNKSKATIKVGKTIKLRATIKPQNATNKKVTWSSSNKKIATVNKNGKVKGIKKGTVTITVKTKNGKKAKCKVYVK